MFLSLPKETWTPIVGGWDIVPYAHFRHSGLGRATGPLAAAIIAPVDGGGWQH